ncbi:MAG TPA: dihydrodipicolinate synthase family protein [Pseudonocardiaceae bacterium]|nr:dihydrodipicolinate synthase family protein [Pseudonocardiaceae bacterium]
MTAPIAGTWFVCPTPFDDGGAVDAGSIRSLVDAAVDWGVDGLTVLGVMGETTALTDAERAEVQDAFIGAADGRVPVAVGCSAASAAVTSARIASAVTGGAAAVMVSAPTLARDTDQIGPFFASATRDAGVPVIVQDEPAATGVQLPVSALVAALDAAHSTIVKLEDPPTPPKISRLLAARSGLTVFGGLGGVSAFWELRRGGAGTMTGFAFPEILRELRLRFEAHDIPGAGAVFDHYLPYIAYEGQPVVGLGIRKEVLRRRGAIACARTRSGALLSADALAELDEVVDRVGLVADRAPVKVTA